MVTLPKTMTANPSSGRNWSPRLLPRNMTARSCPRSSLRVKYMWPEVWCLKLEISPSTQTPVNVFSRRVFEQIGLEREARIKQRPLSLPLDITGEEQGKLLLIDAEDERVVIGHGCGASLPGDEKGPGRMERRHRDAGSKGKVLPSGDPSQPDLLFPDKALKPQVRRIVGGIAAFPHLPHGEVLQDRLEACQMVKLRMGQHHYIDPADPAIPEVGRNDLFSNIEAVIKGPAPVHQDRFPIGELQEDCISLAHIQEGRLKLPSAVQAFPSDLSEEEHKTKGYCKAPAPEDRDEQQD